MKKITALFSFLFLTTLLYSQNFEVKKLEESNPHAPDDIYTFPILNGEEEITRRINNYLIKEQLDLKYGSEKQSIFENVWQKPRDPMARINFLTYTVEMLTNRIYSVTISGEFCSAYCESYDMTYSFDLTTGKVIPITSLFTEAGKATLLNYLIKFKEERISAKLREIKKAIQLNDLSTDEKELHTEMLELYEGCNSEYDDLESFRFIPKINKLLIIYGRCSAHYNRAVDDLWYFKKEISTLEWSKELSETGKELFQTP